MTTNRLSSVLSLGLLLVTLSVPAGAARTDVIVPSASLSSHSSGVSGIGDFFSLSVTPPSVLIAASIHRAYLEIRVDVTAVSIDGHANRAPMIYLFPLKSTFSGTLDANQFDTVRAPFARNVAVGENRRVVFDVTELVKHWAANPAENHGVLIGGLDGHRDGVYSIKSGIFGASSVAKVTILH